MNTISKYPTAYIYTIAWVLKGRFPNISREELEELSEEILIALTEERNRYIDERAHIYE